MTHILEAFRAANLRSFPEVRAFCEAAPFNLTVTESGPLYALRYRRHQSDFKSKLVRQARGIVIEKETNRIVSWAFDKFYEYGESASSYQERPNLRMNVRDASARYERKYDGVLIKVARRPDGNLLVSSNGRLNAELAPTFGPAGTASVADGDVGARTPDDAEQAAHKAERQGPQNLRQAFADAGGLDLPYKVGYCYAFEMMHPATPTVIPVSAPRLVHLTTRLLSGDYAELPVSERFFPENLAERPEEVGFRTFGECRAVARSLPWDDEGFVLEQATGGRVKVKSFAYKSMQCLLAGDSENVDEDALCVALTLDRASVPLPAAHADIVNHWREKSERFAEGVARRLTTAHQASHFGGRTARASRAAFEAAVGGRVPRIVKSAIAVAPLRDENGRITPQEVLRVLRQSDLNMTKILSGIRTV